MSIISRIAGRIFKLPPAKSHDIVVQRGLEVPMLDGIILLTDRYYPRGSVKLPTILIRSPYGRGRLNALEARILAEEGFQVLLQSCRGTFGSGGQFYPFYNEHDDGLATIEWMKNQEWFSGNFATVGSSYPGYAHWTIARDAGSELKAVVAQFTSSEMHSMVCPGESFALLDSLFWGYIINNQGKTHLGDFSALFAGRKLELASRRLPLCDADKVILGKRVQYWHDLLEHTEPGDKWWEPIDYSRTVAEVTAPVNFIGGWYDIFLPSMMRDYATLKNAGCTPYLMIGPWSHASAGAQTGDSAREFLTWLRAHLSGDRSLVQEEPVRIYVMGAKEWLDFPEWPPTGYQPQPWYLQAKGGLTSEPSGTSEPDRYRYDPADPTPSVGGAIINHEAGPKDNRALEARSDVLVYTGVLLQHDLEVIGPVQATLYVRSSLENTDFFVRLCDVYPSGKSLNVCDGIRRLRADRSVPEKDGTIKVVIEMWPTAYRFIRGHRLRLQISSGAHPRFARNLGSGEPLSTGVSLRIADQTIYHDQAHPSCVILPSNHRI